MSLSGVPRRESSPPSPNPASATSPAGPAPGSGRALSHRSEACHPPNLPWGRANHSPSPPLPGTGRSPPPGSCRCPRTSRPLRGDRHTQAGAAASASALCHRAGPPPPSPRRPSGPRCAPASHRPPPPSPALQPGPHGLSPGGPRPPPCHRPRPLHPRVAARTAHARYRRAQASAQPLPPTERASNPLPPAPSPRAATLTADAVPVDDHGGGEGAGKAARRWWRGSLRGDPRAGGSEAERAESAPAGAHIAGTSRRVIAHARTPPPPPLSPPPSRLPPPASRGAPERPLGGRPLRAVRAAVV